MAVKRGFQLEPDTQTGSVTSPVTNRVQRGFKLEPDNPLGASDSSTPIRSTSLIERDELQQEMLTLKQKKPVVSPTQTMSPTPRVKTPAPSKMEIDAGLMRGGIKPMPSVSPREVSVKPAKLVQQGKEFVDSTKRLGNSAAAGLAGAAKQQESASNTLNQMGRKYNPVDIAWDFIFPKASSRMKEQEKRIHADLSTTFGNQQQFYKNKADEGAGPGQQFANRSVELVANMIPTIALSLMGGGTASAASGIENATASIIPGLTKGAVSKFSQQLTNMIPFMVQAGGGYADEAQKAGANLEQSAAMGVAGGLAEGMTELFPMEALRKALGLADDAVKPMVKKGVNNLLQTWGKKGWQWLVNAGEQVFQEVAVSPITGFAEKAIYNKDKPVVGEGGIIDPAQMKQDATGAMGMSLVLAALGLPVNTTSYLLAKRQINRTKPMSPEAEQKLYDAVVQDLGIQKPMPSEPVQNPATVSPEKGVNIPQNAEIDSTASQGQSAKESGNIPNNIPSETVKPNPKVTLKGYGDVEVTDTSDPSVIYFKNKNGKRVGLGVNTFKKLFLKGEMPNDVTGTQEKGTEIPGANQTGQTDVSAPATVQTAAQAEARVKAEQILQQAVTTLKGYGVADAEAKIVDPSTADEHQIKDFFSKIGINAEFYEANKAFAPSEAVSVENSSSTILVRKDKAGDMLWATGHGWGHLLEKRQPELFKEVMEYLDKSVSAENLKKYINTFKDNPQYQMEFIKDKNRVLKEMFADEAGNMMYDKTWWQELYDNAPELFKKIVDSVKKFLDSITGVEYDNYLTDKELVYMKTRITEAMKVEMKNASEIKSVDNSKSSTKNTENPVDNNKNSVDNNKSSIETSNIIDEKSESAFPDYIQFSSRTWKEKRAKVIDQIVNSGIASKQTATKYLKAVDNVMAIVMNDPTRLDYEASEIYSAFKDNSDKHYKKSVDFSTLCKKRYYLQGTIEKIQDKLGRGITIDEFLSVRKALADKGIVVSCGACYVDSRRMELGMRANQYFQDNVLQNKWYAKKKNEDGVPYPEKKPPLELFLSQEGLDKLKTEYEEIYTDFNSKTGARGMKMQESRTEYRHEILDAYKGKPDKAEETNARGGIRWQSWSDFEVPHMIDAMQVIADMYAVKLMGHGYTKVPEFVEVLGRTGLMINMSLIPKGKGIDENGNLVFDPVEGMPFERARELRKKFPTTSGTITIGSTDEMIRAALAHPEIDYVIPYHASGLSAEKRASLGIGMNEWKDYTSVQSEQVIDWEKNKAHGGKWSKDSKKRKPRMTELDEWWDPKRTMEQNQKKYLEVCKEYGLRPKFESFSNEPGYWKLLIDRRMLDDKGKSIIQKAVQPIFDDETNERILSEYNENHRSLPFDQETVDTLSDNFYRDYVRPRYEDEEDPDEAVMTQKRKPKQKVKVQFSSRQKESRQPVKPFFSKLQQVIEQKMSNAASSMEVMNLIRSNQVKADEIKWSGIEEWLRGKGKVSKQEVLDYLKANDLQLKEVTKSKGTKFDQYTVPGGENYREILFTLPEKDTGKKKYRFKYKNGPMFGQPYNSEEDAMDDFVTLYGMRDDIEVVPIQETVKEGYKSSHWSEKNVLAHTRIDDRTDSEGNKVLFVEEIQSDWHQEGRKKGYQSNVSVDTTGWVVEVFPGAVGEKKNYVVYDKQGESVSPVLAKDRGEAIQLAAEKRKQHLLLNTAPDAPFQKTWHEFVLKRLLRYAAENGYDKIAFATGSQNADHYDLSKQIDSITYSRPNSYSYLLKARRDRELVFDKAVHEDDLENVVGKEIAQKMIDGVGMKDGVGYLSGLDLKVGGEGMKGFYDKMIPDFLNRYVKKWGTKVEDVTLKTYGDGKVAIVQSGLFDDVPRWEAEVNGDMYEIVEADFGGFETGYAILDVELNTVKETDTFEEAEAYLHEMAKGVERIQPSITITPAMKESVLYEGQPLYSMRQREVRERGFAKSVRETNTLKEVQDELTKNVRLYERMPNEDTMKLAADKIYSDRAGAKRQAKSNSNETNPVTNAIRIYFMAEAFRKAEAQTDPQKKAQYFEEGFEWSDLLSTKGTGLGQAVQILSIIKRQSPEGAVHYAKRTVDQSTTQQERDVVDMKARSIDVAFRDIMQLLLPEVAGEGKKVINRVKKDRTPEDYERVLQKKMLRKKNAKDLAKQISRYYEDRPDGSPDPIKDMINTLFKKAKESVEEGARPRQRTAIEFISEAVKRKDIYKDVWNRAKVELYGRYRDDMDALADLDAFFQAQLDMPFSENQLESAVRKGLKDLDIDLEELVKKHYSEADREYLRLSTRLVEESGLDPDDAMYLEKFIADKFNELTAEKKLQILEKQFKQKARGKALELYQRIIQWSNLGANSIEKYKAFVAQKLGISAMTPELAAQVAAYATEIQTIPEDGAYENVRRKMVLIAMMMRDIAMHIPPTKLSKVSTYQTIAMLLNLKSTNRNIIGNALLGAMDFPRDVMKALLDAWISTGKYGTGNRTEPMPNVGKMMQGAKRGLSEGAYDVKHRIDTSRMASQFELPRNYVFSSKLGIMTQKMTDYLLRVPDRVFSEAAYESRLYGLMKMKGETEPSVETLEDATFFAARKVMSDKNITSEGLKMIKNVLNGKIMGRKGLDWGLGDFVLKFTQIPGAILQRGIEYSPVSIIKMLYEISAPMYEAHKLKISYKEAFAQHQNKFVDSMANAVVGSSIMLLGFWLRSLGIITGRDDEDKDVAGINRILGLGAYRINLNALWRFAVSFGNPEAAKHQDGDTIANFDWLQPFAIPFSIGANLFDNKASRKAAVPTILDALGTGVQSFADGVNSLVDMTVVRGIKQLFAAETVVDGVIRTLEAVPASLIPSVVNNLRSLFDSVQRNVYDENAVQLMWNMVQNRIPGLSKNVPPRYDLFGNLQHLRDPNGNPVKTFWDVFLNPAIVTKYKLTPEAALVINTMLESGGDTSQFPRTAPKSFSTKINDQSVKIVLSGAEIAEFQKISGRLTKIGFNRIPESASNDKKIEQMVKVLNEAAKMARQNVIDSRIKKAREKRGK